MNDVNGNPDSLDNPVLTGFEDPTEPDWRYNPGKYSEEQLALWAEAQLVAGDKAAEEVIGKYAVGIVLDAHTPSSEASRRIELRQQYLDGFNILTAQDDTKNCVFSRGITPEFWGFTRDEFAQLFANVSERDTQLASPRHIHEVLFLGGQYYGNRKGATLDLLALPATDYTDVVGSVEQFSDRVSKRGIATNEKKDANFDPTDDKVRRIELHALEQKEVVMGLLIERLREEDDTLKSLEIAARTNTLRNGFAMMTGRLLKDRIISAVNGSMSDMLRAMQLQLDWDNETRDRAKIALWKSLFHDPNKITNWQRMLSLARAYGQARLNRYEPRYQDIGAKVQKLTVEETMAS